MNAITYAVVAPHADLFWSKVDRLVGEQFCWLWARGTTGNGYGQFALTPARTGWEKTVTVRAHRVAWMLANRADLPPERYMVVDHRCNQRLCCNPLHLAVTDNSRNLHAGRPEGRAVEPLPSGRHKVRFREWRDGRLVQTSCTFDTAAEALAFSRQLKAEADAPPRIAV